MCTVWGCLPLRLSRQVNCGESLSANLKNLNAHASLSHVHVLSTHSVMKHIERFTILDATGSYVQLNAWYNIFNKVERVKLDGGKCDDNGY